MYDLPDDEILPLSKEHVFWTWSAQAKVSPIPIKYAKGVYFWDTLFSGHLDLKVGLQGRFLSQNRGEEYNPQAMLFVPGAQVTYNMVGSGDLVIMFHIGSAYVHFIWENLVDQKYIVVPFYPMPDRAIKLGISWEFIN